MARRNRAGHLDFELLGDLLDLGLLLLVAAALDLAAVLGLPLFASHRLGDRFRKDLLAVRGLVMGSTGRGPLSS